MDKHHKSYNYLYIALTGCILIVILCISSIKAWNIPTQNPPAGNVPAPLNVSNSSQEKAGALTIASLVNNGTALFKGISTFAPTSNSTSVFKITNTAGDTILNIDSSNRRVGIGTPTPNNLLHLVGTGGNTQGIQIQNDMASSYIYNDTTSGNLLTLIGQNGTQIKPNTASDKGLIIQGLSSQSGNLLEIKNNQGNTLSSINSSGILSTPGITSTGNIVSSSGDVKGARLCIDDNCQNSWDAVGGGGASIPPTGMVLSTQPNDPTLIGAGFTWKWQWSLPCTLPPPQQNVLFIYEKN